MTVAESWCMAMADISRLEEQANLLSRCMASCKDCVHYDVCYELTYHEPNGEIVGREVCNNFKDKSRFVELPCKVGDKVWFIKFMFNFAKNPIPAMVCGIRTFSNSGTFTFTALTDENNVPRSFINQDIGKTVFLNREEAEKALKEREKK